MNAYPFLDSKLQPLSDAELGDIVRPVRKDRMIDISNSPFVAATELRLKLEHLLMAGELDGGLPILRDGVLAGLIPAPDLEFALDTLEDEENTLCLMAMDASIAVYDSDNEDTLQEDFTRYIDPVSGCSLLLSFPTLTYPPQCRLQSPSTCILLSIWYTSALPSWACDICVCFRTATMPALCTKRHL